MFDFFSKVIDFISLIVDAVVMLVSSLAKFITMIPGWIAMLTTSVGFIPGIIAPFILFGMFLTILMMVVFKK